MILLYSILGSISSFFSGLEKDMSSPITGAIEYFFNQFINGMFSLVNGIINSMINIFFNFAYSFQANTEFLGVFQFPVFIVGFAMVGGVIYTIFRLIEGLL